MASAFFLLALLASPQDGFKIEVALREAPDPGPGKPPALVCEGATDLPDRSRLDFWLHYGEPDSGVVMSQDAVEVRGGRYSCVFLVYAPPRNLAGLHSVRVLFDPLIQKRAIAEALGDRLKAVWKKARLQIGGPLDVENDRKKWRAALGGEIEAVASFADRAEALYRRDKDAGKFDAGEWDRLAEEATERSLEPLRRSARVAEYRALGYSNVSDVGLEELRDLMLSYLHTCQGALKQPGHPQAASALRLSRTSMERTKQSYLLFLSPPQADAKLLGGLAEDAIRILKDALEADEAGRARARARFREAIIALDSRSPATFHEPIIRIATGAPAFFEALGADGEKAGKLHQSLERQLRQFIEDIGKPK